MKKLIVWTGILAIAIAPALSDNPVLFCYSVFVSIIVMGIAKLTEVI